MESQLAGNAREYHGWIPEELKQNPSSSGSKSNSAAILNGRAAACVNNKNLLNKIYVTQSCTPPTYIIPDKGCTGHYVPTNVELKNTIDNNICAQMPNARHISSTHCGELPLLNTLPDAAARIAHKIPQHTQSLLLISRVCENDCVAIRDTATYTIREN